MSKENKQMFIQCSFTSELVPSRNIRVKSFRLPSDFFLQTKQSRYSIKKKGGNVSIGDQQTRQTYTPSFQRYENFSINIPSPVLSNTRKIETARLMMNKDDSLINDVISTTKKIKRVFRKKSVQLNDKLYKRQQILFQLPKIKNLKHQSNLF